MGRALEVISGRNLNPGATLTAVTVNTGDSLAVKYHEGAPGAELVQVWALQPTLGQVRIRSPKMHDVAQGLLLQNSATARPLLPYGAREQLYPTDTLIVEQSGPAAAETGIVALLMYYDDLPGSDARLASAEDVLGRQVHLHGVLEALTTGATAGDYGGSQTLIADQDSLKADTNYAILGYLPNVAVGIVGFRGTETANLRIGGPGCLDPDVTSEWFVELSRILGKPCIPVFNSNNRGGIIVDVAHSAAAVAVNITLILAELG